MTSAHVCDERISLDFEASDDHDRATNRSRELVTEQAVEALIQRRFRACVLCANHELMDREIAAWDVAGADTKPIGAELDARIVFEGEEWRVLE